MRIRLSLLWGCLALAVSCSLPGTEACTLIGCQDGLQVQLEGAPPGPWTISVSSQGTSHAKDCVAGSNCGGVMFFENFTPTLVSVTVTRGASTVSYHNLSPTARTVRPNGPRCAPTCSQPTVTVLPPP